MRGGVSVYSINLIKHILSNDIEVHIITTKRNIINSEKDVNYLSNEKAYIHKIVDFHDNILSHIRFQYSVCKVLYKLCSNIKFDIIHSNFPVNGDILYTLFNIRNTPVVTTIHGFSSMLKDTIKSSLQYTPSTFLDSAEKSILRYHPIFTVIERLYLQKITHAIAVSRYAAQLTSQYIRSNKISVVYHGIDPLLFDCRERYNNEPTILFLSRFAAHKGIYTFMKALPLILKEIPNVRILIAGNTDNNLVTEYIRKISRDYKDNLNFIGYIQNYVELPSLYKKADIFVSSSFEDLLGFRLLEAMSCKCTVIATNIGGVPELISDNYNGLLVSAGNYNMLADKIIMACQDSSLRKKLGENARTTILERFTAEKMARNTLEIYNNVT
ncbi:MAG: glycosyltransferase family 4 protein [Candidatus Nitrosocaldus sp.]